VDRESWRDAWRQALTALNIGWDLGLPLVGGTVLGHYLDDRCGAGYTYTLGGMGAGLCIGLYNAVHALRRAIGPTESRGQKTGTMQVGVDRPKADHPGARSADGEWTETDAPRC
jgi:hypothetical protein